MNRQYLLIVVLLVGAACGDEGSSTLAGPADSPPDVVWPLDLPPSAGANLTMTPGDRVSPGMVPTLAPPVQETDGFVVHEWGTFTSVQGSDGMSLDGLHHTDEVLPAFVHGRDRRHCAERKSLEWLPEGVTQKMETPVIYFYGDVPEASVEVEFPGGVISEWFPEATSFGPEVGDVSELADGIMRWDVSLGALADETFPWVSPEDIWAPSRLVASNSVSVDAQNERFIFYRGLGRFELPVRVRSESDGVTLRISNEGDEDIPSLFLLNLHDGGAVVEPLGSLAAGDALVMSPGPKEFPAGDIETYVGEASAAVELALVESGLYQDEARAMVDTWTHSYFRTPGLRLLYVLPREWTDELLPIAIEPQPDALVRTLVGRIEILTAADEDAYRAIARDAVAANDRHLPLAVSNDRFAEPKLRRAAQLSDDPHVSALALEWAETLRVQPMVGDADECTPHATRLP